ncbi:MAG: hypothetical protein HOP17_08915, partial [Acidobacteria bacterium]|nr:hypothetical protein [Acidobacteriota bacterium]
VKAFGNKARIFEEKSRGVASVFGIAYEDGLFRLYKDGIEVSAGPSKRNFFKYLNSALRLEVAEFVHDRIFIHAGVVGWKGRAIIIPGTSFVGKSTLTAELVKAGAEYYSDEYAVCEPDGTVSPFPRHISMRYFGATREKDVSIEELGGKLGTDPLPVGMVLFTAFSRGAKWQPEIISAGRGIMELIPNTLTMRRDPAFSLKVLDLIARRAIIVKSPRGDAKKFAKFLLDFFDNHYKLAKMT